MTEIETFAKCKTCAGEIIFHDNRDPENMGWAHSDKPLEETAGHEALPERASVATREVG